MKNIILTFVTVLSSIALSQEKIIDGNNPPVDFTPKKGDYIVYSHLDDFEGTFVWENNSGERVEIIFGKTQILH